jgi:hypothetical protein
MAVTRKRARTQSGTYRGDDPSTPDVNEAWEEPTVVTKKKATPKKKAATKKVAVTGGPPPGSAAYKAMILRGEIKE